jgi:hypothetical protein
MTQPTSSRDQHIVRSDASVVDVAPEHHVLFRLVRNWTDRPWFCCYSEGRTRYNRECSFQTEYLLHYLESVQNLSQNHFEQLLPRANALLA